MTGLAHQTQIRMATTRAAKAARTVVPVVGIIKAPATIRAAKPPGTAVAITRVAKAIKIRRAGATTTKAKGVGTQVATTTATKVPFWVKGTAKAAESLGTPVPKITVKASIFTRWRKISSNICGTMPDDRHLRLVGCSAQPPAGRRYSRRPSRYVHLVSVAGATR